MQGSIVAVFAWLLVGGLGIPLPEDAALLAAGALASQQVVSVPTALAVALAGVLAGDVSLFLLARRWGPAVCDRPWLRRILSPARRQRVEEGFHKHGGMFVFLARHVVGVRAATFAMAGLHGMRLRRFLAWDAAAACLGVPLVVAAGYAVASHLVRARDVVVAEHVFALVAIAVVVALGVVWLRRRAHPGPRPDGSGGR